MSDREILTMTMAQLAATRPISFEGPTGSAYSSWARELRIRAQAIIDEAAKATAALPAAAQADGEEPSIEACQSAYWLAFNAHGSSDQPVLYAINAVRDLMLRARPAPSHALVEAGDAMRHAPSCPHACWDEPDRSHVANCPYHATELAYDLARSSLPAAKKDA